MSFIDSHAPATDGAQGDLDLGPLAWVLDELRKSLHSAVHAVRRFVRTAEIAQESDLEALDVGPLRTARQQLHQGFGVLEMVGMAAPALLLQAMESAVQKFVRRPETCRDDAAATVERASFALVEYLETVLAGKEASPVALFPQYREVQALAEVEHVHPADLWPVERRFREPEGALPLPPLVYGPQARAQLDSMVLRTVKSGDSTAALGLRDICLGFAAAQTDRQVRAFWRICAGFFDAFGSGLLAQDIYVKRVASRVLMQYATLAKGNPEITNRLIQDLLFFCAQARTADLPADAVPWLRAVRRAFSLERFAPVDYESVRFGRFDPAVLVQARKRIASAAETWSALAGGDLNKRKPVADQFSLVCDLLRKLHPGSEDLAQALTRAVNSIAESAEPPSAVLAMEVATSVLYLQAAFEELDATQEQMEARATRLAQRLDASSSGADPGPLEQWMEDLYRRVSGNQTMGSIVDELRATLGETEKALDQFFRNPGDTVVLATVPGHLSQMRGVLSVIGLDEAARAMARMSETVERLLVEPLPEEDMQGVFGKFANSLGALGFLIDMLGYQRAMARKLFVYDEDLGELRILMGQSRSRASDPAEGTPDTPEEHAAMPQPPDTLPSPPAPAPAVPATPVPGIFPDAPAPAKAAFAPTVPANVFVFTATAPAAPVPPAPVPVPVPAAPTPAPVHLPAAPPVTTTAPAAKAPAPAPGVDDELLDIFLEEAREVVLNGLAAVAELRGEPGDLSEQTTLRRAFHTLKGSSRMVGLKDFGEAAWSMEQVLNVWLAEQKPVRPELLELSSQALNAFGRWVDDIAAHRAPDWDPEDFRKSADAMRLDGSLLPIAATAAARAPAAVAPEPKPEPVGAPLPGVPQPKTPETLDAVPEPALDAADTTEMAEEIDFSIFAAALDEAPPAPPAGPPAPGKDFVFELDLRDQVPPVADSPVVAGLPATPPPAAADPAPAPPPQDGASDEAVKVIGSLRIGIPLYSVYLNEADEWSRRLLTCLQEWSHELYEPVPDTAVALAHSLAGSSATVGFNALSEMARVLEHTLQHVQLQSGGGTTGQAQAFVAAAEDIRRLLHQFAAGFLKEPNQEVLEQLRRILQTETLNSGSLPEDDLDEFPAQPAPVQQAIPEAPPPAPVVWVVSVTPTAPIAPAAPVVTTVITVTPTPTPLAPAIAPPPVAADPVAPALHDDPEQHIDDAIAHAIAMGTDADNDIDAIDVIDPDLFTIFEEEAAELLPQLGGALRQWASRPDNLGARNEVLRALHTLKGSARLAGAMRLGEMAHRLESAIEQLDTEAVDTEQIEPLQASFDGLLANFEALRAIGQSPADTVVSLPVEALQPRREAAETAAPVSAPVDTAAVAFAPPRLPPVFVQRVPLAPQRVVASQSVRVRAQLLDRLVNQAGEVMISRSRLDVHLGQFRSSLTDLSSNLDRLRQQLRDIEVQAESQMQSRLALSKDSAAGFDPLEFDRFTRVQELTRMMAESVNDVATVQRNLQRAMESAEDDLIAQGRQARELQRDLLRTRMVEFEGIAERLYAVVRQASKETGKQIKLDIVGGSIEMDRGVLDRMTPAFEHLLRNCVAHGIEGPQQRAAVGKPASGTITVNLRHEGNDVSVEFRDDGAGLDLPRIRAKAVAQGLVAADAQFGDADAAQLIFMPGFSTASEVTGLAGRGIGMDVVRTEINALGGRIETSTEAGKGTAFRMVLPLTTAVTQVVMLRTGELVIGVPANVAETVRRTSIADLAEAYRSGSFDDGAEKLPFFWSGALLQASARSSEPAGRNRPVVILRSAAQRIAMHVDEVLGNQEVVVKNLGPQLSRLPGLAGMSVLASGAVVLIYNPVALATVYGEQVRAASAGLPSAPQDQSAAAAAAGKPVVASPLAGPSQVPLVLVVDDSITVRRVTQRLLQREGYRVALAADGLQALERLQEERPTVVLSDIEMPRMDGFDLARNIRADGALRDLPIIMITSRIAEKHREHAIELGVNHYLGKPYSDEELLNLIQHYVRNAALAEV
ncbi:response regulator [Verminephrobacter aporrectodeae subsp. tuberculatae]|uniref:hybrid sensor histidine kinase/response regulator n=1 Tax=Verminephrobacter aporrectodeae TaxID=1110389 RepID=UPI0022436B01|nr:Hpt domain-containing protein [Verminephrobacter aporrectodeae]MCW8164861.1 response regulator [Verminephrobacter aporrectodeae subsp. tuberculatae]MCW8169107.1 response regulator [Verminephrobacter aporrectodeae subsp. tuberculatae]MCW8206510.1 response regulator [Verminephrobacter aporrectodeae subsp. tuberculatae]